LTGSASHKVLDQQRTARCAALLSLGTLWLAACDGKAPSDYKAGDELLGGDTTVFDHGINAFASAARNLHGDRRLRFFVGNALFNRNWVTAPSSTEGMDGLFDLQREVVLSVPGQPAILAIR